MSTGSSDFPPAVRAQILQRAGGRCESCGTTTDHLEIHHRRYRSRGGPGTAENGLALCGWGNHTGCHGWAHSGALAASWGLSLASWQDEAAEPFWSDYRAAWLLPGPDGYASP